MRHMRRLRLVRSGRFAVVGAVSGLAVLAGAAVIALGARVPNPSGEHDVERDADRLCDRWAEHRLFGVRVDGSEPVPDRQSPDGVVLDDCARRYTCDLRSHGHGQRAEEGQVLRLAGNWCERLRRGRQGWLGIGPLCVYDADSELERRHEWARARVLRHGHRRDARQRGQALQPEQRHVLLRDGCSISGTVFDDANNNGAKNAGEGGIQGRTVRLYSGSSATPAATATTDAAGGYSFSATQITVGSSFRVCLVAAPGRTQTLPTSSTSNKATCDPTTPRASGRSGTEPRT